MTFPAIQDLVGGNQASDTTSHSVVLPATINADDLLLVWFCADGTPTITWDNATAGTWTLVATPAGTGCRAGLWLKVADGTEDGATLTITTSASEQSSYQVYRISGSTGDIITGFNATTGAWDAPSVTTPWASADTLWLVMAGYDDGTKTPAGVPTNYTNLTTNRTSTSTGTGVTSARRNNATATENPPTFGTSGDANTVTIGIRPGTRTVTDQPVETGSSSGGSAAASTSHSVVLPTGIVAGELLLVVFACRTVATVTWDNATAGTWNSVVDRVQALGRPHLVVRSKVADGTESGATLTIGLSASSYMSYRCIRLNKAASAEGASADGGSTNPSDPPSLTPTWGAKDTLWYEIAAFDALSVTITTPSRNYGNTASASATGAGNSSLSMAYRALNVVDENPIPMTLSSGPQIVVATVGIEPGAAAAGGGSSWVPRAIVCV